MVRDGLDLRTGESKTVLSSTNTSLFPEKSIGELKKLSVVHQQKRHRKGKKALGRKSLLDERGVRKRKKGIHWSLTLAFPKYESAARSN